MVVLIEDDQRTIDNVPFLFENESLRAVSGDRLCENYIVVKEQPDVPTNTDIRDSCP